MKKIFLFAAMAAIAASSCTKFDEEVVTSTSTANSDGSISFGLYTSRVGTKTIDSLQLMQPQIESYQTTGNYAEATSYPAHMVDRTLFYTSTTGRWAVNGIYFWPDSSEDKDVISFFSTTADYDDYPLSIPVYNSETVYPSFDYTVEDDTATQVIDENGAVTKAMASDDNNMEDILVASVMDQSSGQVNLSYQHAMSRVNFKIQGEDNGGKYQEAAKDADGSYYTDSSGDLLYQKTEDGYLVYSYTNSSDTVVEVYKRDDTYFSYVDGTVANDTAYTSVTMLDYLTPVTVYKDTANSDTLVYYDTKSYSIDGNEYTPAVLGSGESYTAVSVANATFYITADDVLIYSVVESDKTVYYKYVAGGTNTEYTGVTSILTLTAAPTTMYYDSKDTVFYDVTTYYTFDGAEYKPTNTPSYSEVKLYERDGTTAVTFYLDTANSDKVIYQMTTYYTVTGDTRYTDTDALTAVAAEFNEIDYVYTLKYIQIGSLANSGTFTFDEKGNTVPGSWTIASTDQKTASYGYYFNPELTTVSTTITNSDNTTSVIDIKGACVKNTDVLDLRIYENKNYLDPTNSLMIMPNDYTGTDEEFTVVVRYAVSSPGWYDDVDMATNGGVDGDDQSDTGVKILDAKVGEIYIATITAKVAYDFVEGESTTITLVLPSPGDLITFDAGVGTFEEKTATATITFDDSDSSTDDGKVVKVELPVLEE